MNRTVAIASLVAFAALAPAASGSAYAAEKAQIVTFDPTGSIGTYPWRANADGTIAGFWFDSTDNTTKGFLRAPDGTITSFDNPDSKVTAAYGINNTGLATGYYSVDAGN